MISYLEAIDILRREIVPLAGRACGPDDLHRGVTVDAVLSRKAVPPFANSAMDGFALRSDDTRDATQESPVELDVWGTVAAGDPPLTTASPLGAAEIMTGAALPSDCDAVIPIERVTVINKTGAKRIHIAEAVAPGRNVRRAGEDFQSGDTVVEAGTLIEPHQLMGLAATGTRAAKLRTAPRVAIIVTGAELARPDDAARMRPGMIEDANGPYLQAALERMGAVPATSQCVPDKADDIAKAISDGAETADLVLTTGGVSAGRYDLIPSVVEAAGGTILFHQVSLRPGKPVLGACLPNGKLLIGLPGNPIAAAVCLRFIATPTLRMMRGLPKEKFHTAISTTQISKRSEFRFFGKARATVSADGKLQVELLPGQESFKISPLTIANSWAIVKEGKDEISAGDLIEVAPLYPDSFLQ